MEYNSYNLGINKRIGKFLHRVVLIVMLHSSFIAPSQLMFSDYFTFKSFLSYFNKPVGNDKPVNNENEDLEILKKDKEDKQSAFESKMPIKKSTLSYSFDTVTADIDHGIIGVSKEKPLDYAGDNIFKFQLAAMPNAGFKAFLSYEIYGVDTATIVPWSINERFATGGYLVKKSNEWSLKREEINIKWLSQGSNRLMFSVPKGANYSYEVRNVKILFEEIPTGAVISPLVLNTPIISFSKNDQVYIKGFVKTNGNDLKVYAEETSLNNIDGIFEGFVSLTKNIKDRGFIVVKALDSNGLLGQELVYLENTSLADQIYPVEIAPNKTQALLKPNSTDVLGTDGAKIIFSENTNDLPLELSISKLRSIDIAPLNSGMINVTKGGQAYRLLPNGIKFKNAARIEMEYDESLLPSGYSANDIKTFRFDVISKSWVGVERDTLDSKEKTITSFTNQSSDYINGIIQSPESPETAGFTPTMMNDIKAADPSAEMTIISPPEVNQKGTANISYPIKIPSGRNGMQPQLSVQYSNEGSSGWLGLGWSLGIPAITIDTRWGVPEFSADYETVIYALAGEQLMYPKIKNKSNKFVDWMPNRHYDEDDAGAVSTDPRVKIDAAVFTPRKQGSFAKIERLGTNPSNYYWKVTNTNGTVSWYGGKSSIDNNYVLRQGNVSSGNIVHWALYMTQDIHGNNITYSYEKNTNFAAGSGVNANLNGGTSFNIKKINYTGYNNTPGLYEILFVTKNTGSIIRKDPTVNARLGLKQVDPYLLASIVVKKTNSTIPIRSYQFNYKDGEFQKTLLENVKELDSNGKEFYKHTFDYYNEVRPDGNNFVLLGKPYTVALPDLTGPSPEFTLGIGNLLGYSKINTSQSIEAGWGIRPSGGIEFKFPKLTQNPFATITVGLPFGESYPKDKGIITMADIDGNGLDDIIYKTRNGLKYFPHFFNQETGKFEFGSKKSITGVSNFSNTEGKSKTMFLESYDLMLRIPFIKKEFYYGAKRFKSESKTNIYFTDGNGDGLLDIVKDKMVLFNQQDNVTGGRKFTTSSQQTPNMLITASVNEIADIEHPEPETISDPQGYDVVRVWIAPKSGTIKINDQIHLEATNNNSSSYYSIETAVQSINNGIPFRLYLNKLTHQVPDASVLITNYSGNNPSLGSSNNSILNVNRGQKIFFRIIKNASGLNDKMITNPIITYLNEPDTNVLLDENLADHKISSYQDGFILSEDQVFEITRSGSLSITWDDIFINQPSDMVTYEIIKETTSENIVTEQVIYNSMVFEGMVGYIQKSDNQMGGHNFSSPMLIQVDSLKEEKVSIRFVVTSDSNLKWKDIEWKPRLQFTPDVTSTSDGMASLETIKYPIAKYSIYKTNLLRKLAPASGWNTPNTPVNYGIKPNINVTLGANDVGSFIMVVKRNGALVGKRYVTVTDGILSVNDSSAIPLGAPININDPSSQFQYSVGYYISDSFNEELFNKYLTAIDYKTAILGYNWSAPANSNSYLPIFVESKYNNLDYLGPLHREWGQFNYNDEMDTSNTIPSDAISKLINPNIGNRYEAIENAFSDNIINPNSVCFNLGSDEEIISCLEKEYIDSLGLPGEVTPENIDDINFDNFFTPEFIDMARNPVLVARAVRAYPNQVEVEKWIGLFDTQYTTETEMRSGSFFGSDFDNVFPDTDESGIEQADLLTGMQAINKNRNSVSYSKTAGWGNFNISKAHSGYSNSSSDFIDINGDRYPDMMSAEQIQLTRMTGGHKSSINHTFGNLSSNLNRNTRLTRQGGSQDLGRGEVGEDGEKTDQGNPSALKGIGVDVHLNGENKEQNFWADLNGDGLQDKIINQNGLKYQLSLGNAVNTGNYSSFNRLNSLTNKPNSLGFSLSAGLDIGSLFDNTQLPVAISLSAGINNSGSTTTSTLMDVNGDGLADLLTINQGTGSVYINTGNGFADTALPISISSTLPSILVNDSNTTSMSVSGSASVFKGKTICCRILFIRIPILHLKWGITASGNANLSISNSQRAFKDFNGDGYVDYIERKGNNLEVYPSIIGQTNLLRTVNNPIGGSFDVSYKVIPVDYDNPHPKWVMTEVTVNDGFDKVNDGFDAYTKTFVYEKGRYDRREREFYGYETVRTLDKNADVPYRTNISKYYNNSYFLNGLLKEQYVIKGVDENAKFSRTINTYVIKELKDTNSEIDVDSSLSLTFDVGGNKGRGTAAVVLAKTTTELYELNTSPQIISEVNMKYDSKGRISEYKYLGNTAINTDDYTTTIKYHDLANNIISIPKEVRVLVNGVEQRKRTSEVNSLTGNIEKTRSHLDTSTFASTVMKYDQYGNVIYVERPNPSGMTMYYNYEYDTVYNKYLVGIKDAYGYASSASYSSDFDKIASTVDKTGNMIKYEYDSFGRTVLVLGPKEMKAGANYTIKFSYFPKLSDLPTGTGITVDNFVPVALTQHFDEQRQKNDIETITFIDGLARPIQIKKDITLNRDASHKDKDYYEAMSVSGKSFFDVYGRNEKQFHPYFEEKTFENKFKLNEHNSPYVATTTYDELDRVTKVTDPVDNTSETTYSLAPDVNGITAIKTRVVTDQNGTQSVVSETYKDVGGKVISTKNEGPDGAIWTKFNYNAINELMSYTDQENITTEYKYDGLGRKIFIGHKDNGSTSYTYDLANNLTRVQTANLALSGAFIEYKYNFNQLIEIMFPQNPDGSINISNVKYEYGSSGNQTGRVIRQEDATGTQEFVYGSMGEVTQTKRTIVTPLPSMPVRTFVTDFNYDSWNRLLSMVYPDGEKVTFSYDFGGNLNAMTGILNGEPYNYIQRQEYDHYEQKVYLKYANNTESYYNYTPELRHLNILKVKTSDGQSLLDNSYVYDKVGNVLGISNSSGATNNMMGGNYTHEFEYDELNRLTVSIGDFSGHGGQKDFNNDFDSNYKLTLKYNNTHGIVEKSQLHNKNLSVFERNTYENNYKYEEGTHKVSTITNNLIGNVETYKYDSNGNLQHWSDDKKGDYRTMYWDESNRLRVVNDNNMALQHYIYDAVGERVLKANSDVEQTYENGTIVNPSTVTFNAYTTYPSGYLVIDGYGIYSKHYFAGSQRIVSRIGDRASDYFDVTSPGARSAGGGEDYDKIKQVQTNDLNAILEKAKMGKARFKEYKAYTYTEIQKTLEEDEDGIKPKSSGMAAAPAPVDDKAIYFYHPDHLGTSTYLTDINGNAYQFFINLPFGETMAEQLPTSFYRTPYKFSGKELDEETGLYYFGARYYDPRASIWLSTDPLMEKYPNVNPYVYCVDNPVNLIDPNGMSPEGPKEKEPPYYIVGFKSIKYKRTVWDNLLVNNMYTALERVTDNAIRFFGHGTAASMYLSDKDSPESYVNSPEHLEALISSSGAKTRWEEMKKNGGTFISYACNNGAENGAMHNYSKKSDYSEIIFVGASTSVYPDKNYEVGKFYSGTTLEEGGEWILYRNKEEVGRRPWNWQPVEIDPETLLDIPKTKPKSLSEKVINLFKE